MSSGLEFTTEQNPSLAYNRLAAEEIIHLLRNTKIASPRSVALFTGVRQRSLCVTGIQYTRRNFAPLK